MTYWMGSFAGGLGLEAVDCFERQSARLSWAEAGE